MRLICISDTHGQHRRLHLPAGDVLIHAGDWTGHSTYWDIRDFLMWLEVQPYAHKILIPGNHETFIEKRPKELREMLQSFAPSVTYLNESGCEIEGVKFWGSPITPRFFDWAFNRDRGDDIMGHWRKIPHDTQVLITHGPAAGRLDGQAEHLMIAATGTDLKGGGCHDLARVIDGPDLNALRVHVFGHFHFPGGQTLKNNRVTHINAAVVDDGYSLRRHGVVFDLTPSVPDLSPAPNPPPAG